MYSPRRRRARRSQRILAAVLAAERRGRELGLDGLARSVWERPALLGAVRRLEDAGLLVRGPAAIELDEAALASRHPLALTMAGRAAALVLARPLPPEADRHGALAWLEPG